MKELTQGHTEGSCPPQIGPLSGHLPPWPQLPATPSPGLSSPEDSGSAGHLSAGAEVDDWSGSLGMSPPSPLDSSCSRESS